MLGIRCPDRHALRRITPIKCVDRELRSPPARAGFIGTFGTFGLTAQRTFLIQRAPPGLFSNRGIASATSRKCRNLIRSLKNTIL